MTTPQRPQKLSPEQKLAATRQEAAKWAEIAADPQLSFQAAVFVRDLARSASAEVELRLKALGHAQQKGGAPAVSSLSLARLPVLPSLDPLIQPAIPLYSVSAGSLMHAVTALDVLAAQRRGPARSS